MTALQELINKWEIESGSYIPNAPIYKAFIEEAKTYLELEKQQIIDAFIGHDSDTEENLEVAEVYYNETYNNLNK